MKPAFDITSANSEFADLKHCTLLLELNEKQLTCAWVNKASHQLIRLRQYHLEMGEAEPIAILQDLVENDRELQQEIREAVVIYNYAESSLIPDTSFSIEICKPVTELINGNAHKGLVLSEKVYGRDIYTIYRIPREVHSLLQRKFSAGKYWHFYSLLLYSTAEQNDDPAGEKIKLYFYPDKFIAAVFNQGQPLLVQSYLYQVPEDVSYYLLNICRQFALNPEQLPLRLCGLIDADSVLYSEITRYFLNVEWDATGKTAWTNEQLNEYPSHYFSPLLQMALCV